jgi:nitrite reductase/ring-hydroxylating ferredoxin subunit
MDKRYPFSPFPSGWFCVGQGSELAPGASRALTFCGQQLVLFRTKAGVAALVDAYCPHMGAHFAPNAGDRCVVDETIRCPMHGFRYDTGGRCVATEYGTKAPPAARLRAWPLAEKNGLLFAYHDPAGRAPDWEVPELPEDREPTPLIMRTLRVRSHPQETSENSVDLGHLAAVHGYVEPKMIDLVADGPRLTARYSFRRRPGRFRLLTRQLVVEFVANLYGLGYSLVEAHVPELGMRTRHLVFATPTDGSHIDLRIGSQVRRPDANAPIYLRMLPWPLLGRVLGPAAFHEYQKDVLQDFPIWENKRYIERPPLAQGDGPIPKYRAWCRQFYPGLTTIAKVEAS